MINRRQVIKRAATAISLLFGWRKAKAVSAPQSSSAIDYCHPSGETVTITTYYLDEGGIYQSVNSGMPQKISAPYWHGMVPFFVVPPFKAPWK